MSYFCLRGESDFLIENFVGGDTVFQGDIFHGDFVSMEYYSENSLQAGRYCL